jgi:hypothetical protein
MSFPHAASQPTNEKRIWDREDRRITELTDEERDLALFRFLRLGLDDLLRRVCTLLQSCGYGDLTRLSSAKNEIQGA